MLKPLSRFGLGILCGLLLFEGSLRLISPLLGPPLVSWNTMQDAKLFKLKSLSPDKIPDTFVLGNSTALIGVNPSIIYEFNPDSRVFNFAMNGSDSFSMIRLALDEIIPNYRVKELVLFFSQGSFRNEIDYASHPYQVAQPDLEKINVFRALVSHLYIYKYRNLIRDPMVVNSFFRSILLLSTSQGIVDRWASDLDDSGYSLLGQPNNQMIGGWDILMADESTSDLHSDLPKGTVSDLAELRRVAMAEGILITIATVPTLEYDPIYRLRVEKLAELYEFRFLQGNDVATKGEFFQDGVHLNGRGAKLFSMWLADKI